jgi:phosphoglycolate phosphatase
MKRSIEAIIFDLDGTLLNTLNDIATCANAVLEDWDCPLHSVDTYADLVGDGLPNLARKALPTSRRSSGEINAFVDAYRQQYATRWNETSTWYPGIPELLNCLCAHGIPLAILSNKNDDFTKVCVSSYFSSIPFREVRGARAGVPLKPDPQSVLEIVESLGVRPSNCLFVGDSEIDIKTGNNAAMISVGVLWGYRSRLTLEEAGARFLISEPAELTRLVDTRVN